MIRQRGQRPGRSANALVEFAVVFPVVMLPMLIGAWEIGRMCHIKQIVHNAAREGARQAATGTLHGGRSQTDEVEMAIRVYLAESFRSAGVKNAQDVADRATIEVQVTSPTGATDPFHYTDARAVNIQQGDLIRVNVKLPLNSVRWINLYLVTSPTTELQASSIWVSMVDQPFKTVTDLPND